MNGILIISHQYPFGGGEIFMEVELDYLARLFDDIWLLPARSAWSLKFRRLALLILQLFLGRGRVCFSGMWADS